MIRNERLQGEDYDGQICILSEEGHSLIQQTKNILVRKRAYFKRKSMGE